MSSDVKRHVHRCSTCSRSAVGRRKASVQAKCQIYTQPAAVVGFDIVGPLKTNVRGEEKYVLSIQCYMTRFVVFVAIPNRKADTVVRALGQHWIHRFGAPVVFVSDNAPEFTAIEEETIAHLEQKLGVKHVYVSSYSPASNLVERVHQQLGRTLRIFVNKLGRAWSECLTEAAFAVNAADLSFAPFSPFYLMHGFQPRIKADIKCLADKDDKTLKKLMREMPDLSEYVAARDPKMKSILSALILARREEREKYTALLNTQRLPPKVYNPGDMCVVWRPPKDAELGSKLSWQNTGPYRVLASQKHGREYRLQHLTTGDICIHSATLTGINAAKESLP